METTKRNSTGVTRFLKRIEIAGNKLPPPSIIFVYLCAFIIIISGIGGLLGWSATGMVLNTSTKELAESTVKVVSMLNISGLTYMLKNMVSNFTGFASLGPVCTIMLAMGVAEQSGWMDGLIRKAVASAPQKLITPLVIFIGIESNICENAGYMIFVPLAAMIFKACGKHPLAGAAAGFAGVSGGYSANLLMGSVDVTLAGLSTSAAQTVFPDYVVQPTSNWYFMFVSTFILVAVGTFITEKVVIPMLGPYDPSHADETILETRKDLTDVETRALRISNRVLLIMVLVLVAACIPKSSFMRNPDTGSLIEKSLLIDAIIPIAAILFMVPGLIYGRICGKFKSSKDVGNAFTGSFRTVSGFLATCFFASQFTNYFKYTKIGNVLAIKGAEGLKAMHIGWVPLIIIFVLFCGFINLMMPSASAKWAIFAPVFVPMLMNLGISPVLTQCAYRIADSSVNVLCPVLSSLPIILAAIRRYEKDSGFGSLVSCMLPYSMAFLILWTVMLIIWGSVGLPFGPGSYAFMSAWH